MKWFKHFTNAHNSNDLTKVRMKYGADGYAIYWYCLELVAGDLGTAEEITFELKHDAEVIGYNLKIDSIRVEEIMRYMVTIGLFDNADGVITCLKLAKYLDKKTTRNAQIHRIIDVASATVPDSPPTVPLRSPLDTDTDTDTELEINTTTGENSERVSTPVRVPFSEIVNLYHEKLPELSRVQKLTNTRKGNIRQRWLQDLKTLDAWANYFDYIRDSDFLMGRVAGRDGKPPFRADLEWLTKDGNFTKVAEDKYHAEVQRAS